MNREFVPYDVALAMKEFGFNEECLLYYDCGIIEAISFYRKSDESHVVAPLYQQAFRWFREKYNIKGYVMFSHIGDGYSYWIFLPKQSRDWRDVWEGIYEEAELACLRKLIEIVKDEKN